MSSFATATSCLGRAVVKIDDDIPLEIAALVGCGVATGSGAALNTVPVPHGSGGSLGLGGVRLAVLMGARVRGAAQIIAVELLGELGATHDRPRRRDTVKTIKALTGRRGADIAFEVVGRAAAIGTAFAAARPGGTTCVVGAPPPSDHLTTGQ